MSHKTPAGRLTEAGVRAMRKMRDEKKDDGAARHTYQAIANSFGVTLGTVFNVCTGRTWGWLT